MSLSDWFDLVALLRGYCLRKYGCVPTRITLDLPIGQAVEPIPPYPFLEPDGGPDVLPICRPEPPAQPEPSGWASGPGPKHTDDFRRVYRPGLTAKDGSPAGPVFAFSRMQALAVGELWAAWRGGSPEVRERELLAAADSTADRLADLFKRHPAWGVLVVRGESPGTFRLAGAPPKETEA